MVATPIFCDQLINANILVGKQVTILLLVITISKVTNYLMLPNEVLTEKYR